MSWATGHHQKRAHRTATMRAAALLALAGIGAACSPSTSVTPSANTVDFGPVTVDTVAAPKEIEVKLDSVAPIIRDLLGAVVLPAADNPFTVEDFECPESEDVPAADPLLITMTCHLTLGYAPTKEGTFTGDVRVLLAIFPIAQVTVSGSTSPDPVLPEAPLAVALPLAALAALGGGVLVVRRRQAA